MNIFCCKGNENGSEQYLRWLDELVYWSVWLAFLSYIPLMIFWYKETSLRLFLQIKRQQFSPVIISKYFIAATKRIAPSFVLITHDLPSIYFR